jgi:SAM-dependent methyltransferase
MIGGLLKDLVVQTGRYIRYHASRTFGGERAVDAPPTAPVDGKSNVLVDLQPPPADTPSGSASLETRDSPVNPVAEISAGLRLDLGCGPKKCEGFFGIDRRRFPGVDGVTDLTKKRWIFDQSQIGGVTLVPASLDGVSGFELPNDSVSEVHCSHFLEHLEHNQAKPERVRFMNELWRVLIPGGQAKIITPHWASNRAYGDFTHADKPVSEMFYYYLNKSWRKTNAPDNDIEFNPDGYTCDFDFELARTLNPDLNEKDKESMDFAANWYKDAVMDLHATLVAKK